MPIDFNKSMDKYLANKRKKRLFSDFRSSITNKKTSISYKVKNNFSKLKNRLASHIRIERKEIQKKPAEEIAINQINDLAEKKGIKNQEKEKIEDVKTAEEEGWKEIKIQSPEEKEDLTDLKEEMEILKEKGRIEEERLSDLKKARRIEQMKVLQDRVKQALFRKEPELREELKPEKKGDEETETKKQAEQKTQVSFESQKPSGPEEQKIKDFPTSPSKEAEEQKKEMKKTEAPKEKPKKSFFSKFIEIKTAEEISKEEEERSKQEEERALKDQLEISKLLQLGSQETKSNIPADNSGPNFSTLFPEQTQNMQDTEDSIQLDQDYKIKITRKLIN